MKPDLWYHGLSPTHPELRAYRLSQFETKVNNPLIDGVWLDFIRYPVRWEGDAPRIEEACFSSHSLAGFERFADIDLPDGSTEEVAAYILDSHPEVWLRYKCEVIRSWVAEAQSIMKTARPEMTLGLFMVPWLADDFDIAIERIVGQDAELLAPHVDVISPMLYHRMIHRPLERITTVVNSVQERTGAYVWPITQAMSEPDTLSTEEFREAIRIGVEASGSGVLVFGANHVENEQRWEQLQEVFTAID